MSDFYRAFEEKYRGPRELILKRLRQYKPFVLPLLDVASGKMALDLGCGRGEWLEILSEYNLAAQGVDLDSEMLSPAKALGLDVYKADALTYLQSQSDESLSIVSAFHLVEHLPFSSLRILISEAYRALMPGGLIILETPNPENILVSTTSFYLDPTHLRPLPPALLAFCVEHAGFNPVKIVRLQEPFVLRSRESVSLIDVLSGVSRDYSIVAQKPGSVELTNALASPFALKFGTELMHLTSKYDESAKKTEGKLQSIENMLNNMNALDVKIQQRQTENELQSNYILNSIKVLADKIERRQSENELQSNDLQQKIDYMTHRSVWERLLFKMSGEPRTVVRRLVFHKNGKPRKRFKFLVCKKNGEPRQTFRMWIASGAYQKLPHSIQNGQKATGSEIRTLSGR